MQGRVAIKRPNQKGAENGLAKNVGDLRGRKVVADFAPILTELNHLGVEAMHPFLQIHHGLANRSRRKIGLKKRANNGGVASGLLGHADAERAKELRHRLARLAGHLDGGLQLAELHFHECQQDVVFAWEIIEKGALTDVSSLGNVLDSRLSKTFLGEKIERGAEQSFANFGAATLSAIRRRMRRRRIGGWERLGTRSHSDH